MAYKKKEPITKKNQQNSILEQIHKEHDMIRSFQIRQIKINKDKLNRQ